VSRGISSNDPSANQHPVERAAQYVRMSTDHQKYSIDNQAEIITAYAAIHNYIIVQTYTDAGKSGLSMEGRGGLRQLIDDVQSGRATFTTVLVYDVSRWGRFQNADESAHYEFICKQAGVSVQYCAEKFENDGSLIATLIKGMKRAMAAEFSRELSFKVFEGQKRLSRLGFRRGGTPGYGLRRLLVDEHRIPKGLLQFGQEKHLQTDRVILVPGPPNEIEVVRAIFKLFVNKHTPPSYIARILNEKQITNAWGNRWTTNNVFKVLRNESYIGDLVYNKSTSRLMSKRRPNPCSMWIRTEGVFEPIIDRCLFSSAQHILTHPWTYSTNEILDFLTAALCINGHLSYRVIANRKCGPSSTTIFYRFGTLTNAFRAVGYYGGRQHVKVGDPLFKPSPRTFRPRRDYSLPDHSKFRFRP
jgi:DNA invertase Pin-like site-specific DNA recombinase